jgi:ethylene-insensitive protein 3
MMSALIQHCEPPQRSFPLGRGLAPPWWRRRGGSPGGRGAPGEAQAHQGVSLYRKSHDLEKAWKISLLSAVIKHLTPLFDQMRKLVWQSKRLQHNMSARDAGIWARVIAQEEALDRHVHRELRITPLLEEDQHDGDSPKGEEEDAARFGKRKRRAGGGDEGGGGGSEMQQMSCRRWTATPSTSS